MTPARWIILIACMAIFAWLSWPADRYPRDVPPAYYDERPRDAR